MLSQDIKDKFFNGTLYNAYDYFGSIYDPTTKLTTFTVFAPRAKRVFVVGDFNNWDNSASPMNWNDGIWQIEVADVKDYSAYKYCIATHDGRTIYKSDPYAIHADAGEKNSKVVHKNKYRFTDSKFQKSKKSPYNKPMHIYEVHIGSFKKYADGNFFDYKKFADEICPYVNDLGFTHIELIGIAEYPFDGSWGYQITNFFAPTSRYGRPEDFAYLVNKLHQSKIGVILDWVPGHFVKDENGLFEFDGYPLYEPEDELNRGHKEWGTNCFDYSKGFVKSFLISNAMYWLKEFKIDGLRVDAVSSMLYLNYARDNFTPNRYGGIENLDALEFFRQLSTVVFEKFPNALLIAEESTAWPMVTKPVDMGGLGFNFKWSMGFINDTLDYIQLDPFFRGSNHNKLTFSMHYAFSENFVLAVSHDEVVHGKKSLLNKMPLGYQEKFAGWRQCLAFMFCHPGKKLTMMGTEFAQFSEWAYQKELDWGLLEYDAHKQALEYYKTLSHLYKKIPALYEIDDSFAGFDWRVVDDTQNSVIAFERIDKKGNRLLCVFNFSNLTYEHYLIGLEKGEYKVVLSSDVGGFKNGGEIIKTQIKSSHNMPHSLELKIEPLSAIIFEKINFPKTPKKC